MSELKDTIEDIANSYSKITVKPIEFKPVDLDNTEEYIKDLTSFNRAMNVIDYVRVHHPAVFEAAYRSAK